MFNFKYNITINEYKTIQVLMKKSNDTLPHDPCDSKYHIYTLYIT